MVPLFQVELRSSPSSPSSPLCTARTAVITQARRFASAKYKPFIILSEAVRTVCPRSICKYLQFSSGLLSARKILLYWLQVVSCALHWCGSKQPVHFHTPVQSLLDQMSMPFTLRARLAAFNTHSEQ